VTPRDEQELLRLVREIDVNTNETMNLVREVKAYRKFILWAFSLMATLSGAWEFFKTLKGL
jgi:hypothetical protein